MMRFKQMAPLTEALFTPANYSSLRSSAAWFLQKFIAIDHFGSYTTIKRQST
jgi:hypothetical protein